MCTSLTLTLCVVLVLSSGLLMMANIFILIQHRIQHFQLSLKFKRFFTFKVPYVPISKELVHIYRGVTWFLSWWSKESQKIEWYISQALTARLHSQPLCVVELRGSAAQAAAQEAGEVKKVDLVGVKRRTGNAVPSVFYAARLQ